MGQKNALAANLSCLDGVSLVVVVGEVEELEVERGPQPLDHLGVQAAHGDVAVAKGE